MVDRILKYLFFDQAVRNSGIAFGINLPNFILIILFIITSLILVPWLIKLWTIGQHLQASLVWLIILGASSNIIDRIKFGFVVDYINLKIWPVFNIADIIIVISVAVLFIYHFRLSSTS